MWEQNGKDNTRKNNSTTGGNKPESSGVRREIKEISKKGKTIETKQNIPTKQGITQKHTHNRTPKNPNIFGRKYGNQNSITKKMNG